VCLRYSVGDVPTNKYGVLVGKNGTPRIKIQP